MIEIINNLNGKNIQKLITVNFEKLAPTYYRLISEWMNSSYEVFLGSFHSDRLGMIKIN